MRSGRRLAILFALAAPLSACSEDSPTRDGASSASSTTTGSASAGGGGSAPVGSDAWLGLACEDDGACGPGGRCLQPTDDAPLGGGPAGGYCVRACSEDAECPGLYSRCIKDDLTGAGSCFLGCEIGPPGGPGSGSAPLDPAKCRGREDVRCGEPHTYPPSSFPPANFCMPTCGMDAQCPAGRKCDPKSRVCVTMPHPGLAMGAKCDAGQSCGGWCEPWPGGVAVCTNPCVYAGKLGGTADCGGLGVGLCALAYPDHGPGDEGLCIPACDEQDDCAHPWFWCTSVLGPGSDPGYCMLASAIASCPSGTCAKGKCTETIYGPLCLESKYPLGSAAPGGGGAGGATGAGGAAGAGGN